VKTNNRELELRDVSNDELRSIEGGWYGASIIIGLSMSLKGMSPEQAEDDASHVFDSLPPSKQPR
jgi:hypothetical protein